MPIKLMYITNNPAVAVMAQNAGVNRIFLDMEHIGKEERQPKMDTVKNFHTVDDIKAVRSVLTKAELLVRVNPMHSNSQDEINAAIAAGADVLMLPMWTTCTEAADFIKLVAGRARVNLLLENEQARRIVSKVVELDGVDEMYIGLNDLHISQNKKFLFQPLADGTVEGITKTIAAAGIPYGFGGLGRIGKGLLPAKNIIAEHYRLASSMVILSRAFLADSGATLQQADVATVFEEGIKELRDFESELENASSSFFEQNRLQTANIVESIVASL